MKLSPDGNLVFSPSDLIVFLEGDFASWMDRARLEAGRGVAIPAHIAAAAADEPSDETALFARLGDAHERAVLERLHGVDGPIVTIDRDNQSRERTLEALTLAQATIFQGHLADPPFEGYADFLRRVTHENGTAFEPWDSKLARSTRPYFLVQLCCYAAMLARVQGHLPARLGVILGTGDELTYPTTDFIHYYRHLRRRFLAFQDRFDPSVMPDPALERGLGSWSDFARQELIRRDDLRLLAGVTRSQIARLRECGIQTLAALATGTRPPDLRIKQGIFDRLQEQARLQITSRGQERPVWIVVPPPEERPGRGLGGLPPATPYDVYLDFEGYPLLGKDGLEYLVGAVTIESGSPEFHDWWAHDSLSERRAFEAVVDWLWSRWRAQPALHIYHYAPYEKTALRRLAAKYATREDELDDLLRNEVLVDLYPIVRQGMVVGTESYSLKDIERLYRGRREGTVTAAGGSMVAYQNWIDSGEPGDWRASPRLAAIRDYNRDDCVSTWELAEWLRKRQTEAGIPWAPIKAADAQKPPSDKELERRARVEPLEQELLRRAETATDPESGRVTVLLAHLLQFHRREARPVWWELFDRAARPDDELVHDHRCLVGMERTSRPPFSIKRSFGYEYRFDTEQDFHIHAGDTGRLPHDLDIKASIESIDPDAGLVVIKTTAGKLPKTATFIEHRFFSADAIADSIFRFVTRWSQRTLSDRNAVIDVLHRRAPRRKSTASGPLIPGDTTDFLADLIRVVADLDDSSLCIQGPPGTGKTWSTAQVILALVNAGHRVGVASNSHSAIRNLMVTVAEHAARRGTPVRLVKAGQDDDGLEALAAHGITQIESGDAAGACEAGPLVLGGTAWVFSREDMQEPTPRLDYLFVDEAGQVSLANLVGMGSAARNLVLIGDQMQLAQPVKGSHPDESGDSCLEYALQGHATVPPDRGVFLPTTWRMHPDICEFVSAAVYEHRLHGAPITRTHRLELSKPGPIDRGTGIVLIDVDHDGNTQDSEEEVAAIGAIVDQLEGGTVEIEGTQRPFDRTRDILIVAPYNLQVHRLRQALPDLQIGTVDKFQGLEAPVVIVSMCASSLEDAPRGAAFLLNPNRLNVAISRAQCLAVVVGSPDLTMTRCTSVAEMKLVNLYCHLRDYATGALAE